MDIQKLYLDPRGRIARKAWWLGTIGLVIIAILIQIVISTAGSVFGMHKSLFGQGLMALAVIAAIYVPYYALTLKRLHDRGRPELLFYLFIGPSIAMALLTIVGLTGTMQEVEIFGQKAVAPKYNLLGKSLNLAGVAVGLWALVELGFLKGQSGPNAHGEDPLA